MENVISQEYLMQAKTLMSQEEARKEQKRAEEPGSKFNQLANKMQAKQ